MKYAVLSDIHAHAWSVFASANSDGVNSRLRIILDEILRAARVLKASGGDTMIICGDIFHTRGSIDPEVLNPVRETFQKVIDFGISVIAIPGNHDLKARDTEELGSAIQNLDGLENTSGQYFSVYNSVRINIDHGHTLGFVPWRDDRQNLMKDLETLSKHPDASEMDVFIHAGIDGVLSGVPAHGLTAADLAKFGFRRVFAGDYHNHRDMGSGVYSVGATTHQTWGDVGTRAGFLIVDSDTGDVIFNDTAAPKFVDVSGMSEDDMELECDGNYVRFRGPPMTQSEIAELRKCFTGWGAKGVQIEVPRTTTAIRSTAPTTGLSLDQSVDKFIDDATVPSQIDKADVKKRALEVLNEVRAVTEEA